MYHYFPMLDNWGPNNLEPIQISEIFRLVKATAATCVIVTAPYLHSVLERCLCCTFTEHTTLLPNYLLAFCWYTSRPKHDLYTEILIIDQLVLVQFREVWFRRFGFGSLSIRINEGPLYSVFFCQSRAMGCTINALVFPPSFSALNWVCSQWERGGGGGGGGHQLKVTGYSLLINYSWAILIHYFAKSECWMEPSTMVLCKMDKYYNQLKF